MADDKPAQANFIVERINANQLPKRRAAGFRNVYANNASIRPNLFDFALTFTHIQESGEPTQPIVNEEEVCVVMSPQQFKALLQLGQRFLDDYEKENGVLNIENNKAAPTLPPEILTRLQDALKKAGEAAKGQQPDTPERGPNPSENPSTELLRRGVRRLTVPRKRAKKP